MTIAATRLPTPHRPAATTQRADGVRFDLVGPAAEWFALATEGESVSVRPVAPLPRRCTIRPAALFDHHAGVPNLCMVMGRMVFARGDDRPQCYTPFTHDPRRRLREVYLPIETMPDDDWPTSRARWENCQTLAHRVLRVAGIEWKGLSPRDLDELVGFALWNEPLEGCMLHALAQWACVRGECVVEVGSFRGRSAATLAMALRGAGSDAHLISVDPHLAQPHNLAHVRLALAQLGEERRLVQFACGSDRAWRVLRPGAASMVFIDGDHNLEQVIADYRHYRDLLAPGGVLAFHDYGFGDHNALPDTDPGVRRAVDEQVLSDSHFRPLLLAHTLFTFVKG
ncbi:MAG: class I SAM-dependent methyltransferase [Planctomycetes bacterium]|nr:class I SAM-dependent methyltransferase [Planctomycetota bacterium]